MDHLLGLAKLLQKAEADDHDLGPWRDSRVLRGYREADCRRCGQRVVSGQDGSSVRLPPCKPRGAHRPDTRRVVDGKVVDLGKAQPTLTFPKLHWPGRSKPGEFADDRRETPVVQTQAEVDLRDRLADRTVLQHYKAKDAEEFENKTGMLFRPRGNSRGMTSRYGVVSYAQSTERQDAMRDKRASIGDERSTKLHEDVHQMFGRVARRFSRSHREFLVRNLVASLPEDERRAVQDFSEWKRGAGHDDHEEYLADLISYHNNPLERAAYRRKRFHFFGRGMSAPDYPSNRRESEENAKELTHDQAMKRALHRLRRTAAQADVSWARYRPGVDYTPKTAAARVSPPQPAW